MLPSNRPDNGTFRFAGLFRAAIVIVCLALPGCTGWSPSRSADPFGDRHKLDIPPMSTRPIRPPTTPGKSFAVTNEAREISRSLGYNDH